MAAYRPWRDKNYLHSTYVAKRMTLDQIVEDCKALGYSVTPMTIWNNLKSFDIPIRGGSRNLGKRSVGGGGKRGGFYG